AADQVAQIAPGHHRVARHQVTGEFVPERAARREVRAFRVVVLGDVLPQPQERVTLPVHLVVLPLDGVYPAGSRAGLLLPAPPRAALAIREHRTESPAHPAPTTTLVVAQRGRPTARRDRTLRPTLFALHSTLRVYKFGATHGSKILERDPETF